MTTQVFYEAAFGGGPRIVRIITTDSLATITTPGWLNSAVSEGFIILPTDTLLISYATNVNFFTQTISNGIYTVSLSEGNVLLPTITNHIAVFANTTGGLTEDPATAISGGNIQAGLSGTAGYLASFPSAATTGSFRVVAVANTGNTLVTLSNALHGQASVYSIPDSGAATANILISKLTGTQHITVGSLQVDAGNLTAGSSGSAGTITSFPATAANGSLILAALNAGGAFNTTIRNSVMGQSSVYSLGDIGAATGGIPVATSVFVMKSVAGAAAAGGAAAQSFTDAFCTSGSNIIGNWNTQANAVSVLKIVPGNGSFVVTSSGDAGVGTFNYIITK
jgi:hypothetical protein